MILQMVCKGGEVRVGLQLSGCVGELQAKRLSVLRVEANPLYRIVRWLVIGCWALLAIVVCGPGALKEEAKHELLNQAQAYSNQVVEHGGVLVGKLPAELRAEKWLSFVGAQSAPEKLRMEKLLRVDITKVAHFLLFAMLGGLLYVRQDRGSIWWVVVDSGMLACGTELVQLFVDDRSALVGDVVLDMVGVGFLGFWLLVGDGGLDARLLGHEGKLRG